MKGWGCLSGLVYLGLVGLDNCIAKVRQGFFANGDRALHSRKNRNECYGIDLHGLVFAGKKGRKEYWQACRQVFGCGSVLKRFFWVTNICLVSSPSFHDMTSCEFMEEDVWFRS